MFTSLELRKRQIKGDNRLQIWYKSITKSNGSTWEGEGSFCDIYVVDSYIIAMTAGSQKPFMVCTNLQELKDRISEKTDCELKIDESRLK